MKAEHSFPDQAILRHFATTVLRSNLNNLCLLQWFGDYQIHLYGQTSSVFGFATQSHAIARHLNDLGDGEQVDPDHVTAETLANAMETNKLVVRALQRKRDSIAARSELAPESVACVIDEYCEAMDAQMALHDALMRLSEEIVRHDDEITCLQGPFPQVERLLSGIMAGARG